MPAPTRQDLEKERAQHRQDKHDHMGTDPDRLDQVLFLTVDALKEAHIPYALIGGIAVKGLGRPRSTNDIDIFVHPDDAEGALKVLKSKGFETEKRDPKWIYKAWHNDVLVDIIFRSTGDIYFDETMQKRVKSVLYKGRTINTVSPEDFIVIKSVVASEACPHHWHDALAVLTHGTIDWDYLLERSRKAPRRVLALLIYGQSGDIQLPDTAIRRHFEALYGQPESNEKNKAPKLKSKDDLRGKLMEKPSSQENTNNRNLKNPTNSLDQNSCVKGINIGKII